MSGWFWFAKYYDGFVVCVSVSFSTGLHSVLIYHETFCNTYYFSVIH